MIELIFLKELMLIKQSHQKSVMFVASDFLNYIFKFQPNVSNRYHDLVMMSVNFSDMSILLFQTLKVLIIIVLLV